MRIPAISLKSGMCPRSEWNTFLLPERRTGQSLFIYFIYFISPESGTLARADPGFQVKKKIAPSGGRRENFGGISCEKSRYYVKKS
jgi:hypothetical protein